MLGRNLTKGKKVSITDEAEEYLEAIYRLEERKGFARTVELANRLEVVPGSVTNTVEGLEKRGLVIHEPYRGIKLTSTGRKIALSVLRRHRLAERMLTDILHFDWSMAHDAACRLEHAVTKDIVKQLGKTLGHPKVCPHGNPIPTAEGRIATEESEPLSNLHRSERGIIVRIVDENTEILQRFTKLGLKPGVQVEVRDKSSADGSITIRVGENNYTLNRETASTINVRRAEDRG